MPPELSLVQRRAFLRTALSLARKAGAMIRRVDARGPRVRTKKDGSYVTDADLAAERLLRKELSRRFPDHGIQGEEFPPVRPQSPYQWLLDPIDGTLSFTREIPLYGTIIGLSYRGAPLAGAIGLPGLSEVYGAAAGLGSFRNGKRIKLAPSRPFKDELIGVCYRDQFARCGKAAVFDRLMKCGPQVRTYGDCSGHAFAVRGALGAMIDLDINPWDLAATQILVEEAGGKYVVLARRGAKADIVFGKKAVVDRLLPLLK